MKASMIFLALLTGAAAHAQTPNAITAFRPLGSRGDRLESTTGAWAAGDSIEYTYDFSGRLEDQRRYKRSKAGWEPTERQVNRYGRNGKIAHQLVQAPKGRKWKPDYQVTWQYEDGSERMMAMEFQRYRQGRWRDWKRSVMTYSPDGLETERILSETDATGSWTPKQRSHYTIVLSGSDTLTTIADQFDWKDGAWQPRERSVQDRSRPELTVVTKYRYGANRWIEERRELTTRNDGQIVEIAHWRADAGAERSSSRETFEYDADGRCREHRWLSFRDTAWQTTQVQTFDYDAEGRLRRDRVMIDGKERRGWQRTFAYPQERTLPPTKAANRLRLFPNPASERVQIEWDGAPAREIALYNDAGQRITGLNVAGPGPYVLSLAGVKNGVYRLRVTLDGDRFVIGQLVVQQ